MNKNNNPNSQLLMFMLRVQQVTGKDDRAETGYAMVVVSIITILLFSMLGAFMTLTNINKTSTNAYIDGNNSFYAAESGLNFRAQELRKRFTGFTVPTGNNNINAVAQCYGTAPSATPPANDFDCWNWRYTYRTTDVAATNQSSTASSSDFSGGSFSVGDRFRTVNYTAFTYAKDTTQCETAGATPPCAPAVSQIPAGEPFAGLNSMSYKYTVFATAAKVDPSNDAYPLGLDASNATTANDGQDKTVLQMDFTSRIVPLFQFAAFYKEDMELNSTATMTLNGRVHSNGNLYIQPTPQQAATAAPTGITTYLNSTTTSAGNIYNRVAASSNTNYWPARVLQSGNPFTLTPPPVYYPDSLFRNDTSSNTPFNAGEIAAFGGRLRDGNAGIKVLETPDAGFLRKRNYFNNKIGDYFSKADLRLEMVPDRDLDIPNGGRTTTPWTRDTKIIPFNFTAIHTGGTNACTTTTPVAGTDPSNTYIHPDRMNKSNLRCNIFTKGQLQSLRQPVLSLTDLVHSTAPLRTQERGILDDYSLTVGTPLTGVTLSDANKTIVARALQTAIVSQPEPVKLDDLNNAFNTNITTQAIRAEFIRLLAVTTVPNQNLLTATTVTPNQVAATIGGLFLPAPIQRIETTQPAVQNAAVGANNLRRSGFYDGREQRWITMLQTNIVSLAVWNRDGMYVEANDNNLNTAYATNAPRKDVAFGAGTITTSTDNLAYVRAAVGSRTFGLPSIGLGAVDGLTPVAGGGAVPVTTEGGLVFHATVNDDLDGSGGALVAANDAVTDTTNPILKTNPDGSNTIVNGATVTVDYPRRYNNGVRFQSPFGFAFNGGNYLPGPMTLATDQAIYIQGDFNNNGAAQNDIAPVNPLIAPDANRFASAIMADTITVLSNNCIADSSGVTAGSNDLGVPAKQIKCGMPKATTGSINIPGAPANGYYVANNATAVNAAFLSSTIRSCGNWGRAACTGGAIYSGGLNNYMRMLEDWGGGGVGSRYFNYSGSFVSLGTPLEYSGNYFGGGAANSYYNVPTRNFNFDRNFEQFNLLPPLPPVAVFLKQDVFKRGYQ